MAVNQECVLILRNNLWSLSEIILLWNLFGCCTHILLLNLCKAI